MKAAGALAIAFVLSGTAAPLPVRAQSPALSGEALVSALRHGGYVIVMRHASSPREVPTRETARPDNATLERQLDEAGRASATAMGASMRALKIPIGAVLSSPTYRALETVRLAQLENAKTYDPLGDGGRSMQDAAADPPGAWLKKKVAELPTGTNTIIVTHLPNISRAFPSLASGVADGEALVFGADGKGGSVLVGRIKIDEWPRLRGR